MMRNFISFAVAASMLFTATAVQDLTLDSAAAVTVTEVPSGTYLIRNGNSGLYMEVQDGTAANGTNVQQQSADSGNAHNVWQIAADSDGTYQIYSMLDGGNTYCLTAGVYGDSTDISMCIWEDASTDTQRFTISPCADGTFRILTESSNSANAVEVINADTSDGADIQQWEVNGHACQTWELIPIDYVNLDALTETNYTSNSDTWIPGDANDDGFVNGIDLTLFRTLLLENLATEHQQYAGNVNGDEAFTAADLVLLQQYLLGMDQHFTRQSVPETRVYAAIDGTYTEGVSETVNDGYLADAYLNLDNAAGITASWNLAVDTDGVYAVTFRYANGGTADRTMYLNVNNAIVYWQDAFAVTGAWTSWDEVTLYLPLQAGVNYLSVTSMTEDGAPNLDTITVTETAQEESASNPLEPIVGIVESSNTYGEGRQMEALDRGVVAAYTGDGMLVSWRSLATDAEDTTFNLYQNGTFVTSIQAEEATNYFVSGATASDSFTIDS